MDDQTTVDTPKKGKGKIAVIVILGLLLAGSLGSNYWLYSKEQSSSELAISKIDSLNYYNSLKDSLYAKINEEELKVHNLRTEIAMYQSDNDSLRQLLEEKLDKIAALRAMVSSGGSTSKLRALKDSLERLTKVNAEFKQTIETVLMENEDYKAKMLAQQSEIDELNSQKRNLTDKVEVAAQPKVGSLNVVPTYEKKGQYIPMFKAKKVDRLEISFDVLANKLTEKKVEKVYIVRIIDPDGIVLSNNNNQLSNSSEVYTAKETVNFDGKLQKFKINHKQSASYKKGKYKVELKEDEVIVQTAEFVLI